MHDQNIVSQVGGIALVLLKTLESAAETFPPLKSVAGVGLTIGTLVKEFRSNQREWEEFSVYVLDVIACLVQHISTIDDETEQLRTRLDKFLACLESILLKIQGLRSKSRTKRFFTFVSDPQEIDGMRRELQQALNLFELDINLSTQFDVSRALNSLSIEDIGKVIEEANRKLGDRVVINSNLDKLLYVEGASWNKNRACLQGTRTSVIEEIMTWTRSSSSTNTAEIFLFTGVAGSGKTSLAHSIAQHCFEEKTLLSAFFFHKGTADLNAPKGLITTLARDLARVNPVIAETIALAIEDDPALPTASSLSLQFQRLIIEPLKAHPVSQPLVIVIDALEEGCNNDHDFLIILRDDIPRLPPAIRVFVTSRPDNDIMRYFPPYSLHVQRHFIDIAGRNNRVDILTYIRYRLAEIDSQSQWDLGPEWPREDLVVDLADKSEGLFIWASTVVGHIEQSISPEDTLQAISSESTINLPPGKKMDNLYAAILRRCNWDDSGFRRGYSLLMGALIVSRTPLSLSAVQQLHRASDVKLIKRVMSTLGSILPSPSDPSRPLQLLHSSFRDFVTLHAEPPYSIDEKYHSQRLAHLCLQVLNEALAVNIPGTGYLVDVKLDLDESLSVPTISSDRLSGAAWYACRFWIDHVLDVDSPSKEFTELFATFISLHLIRWVELVVALGRYREWSPVWTWMKEHLQTMPTDLEFEIKFSQSIHCASISLATMGRRREALESIRDATELRRVLFAKNRRRFLLSLSSSLDVLSRRFSALGYHDDALTVAREAVTLCKELVAERPHIHDLVLARTLMTLSHCLTHTNVQEALETIQEASVLCQGALDTNETPECQWLYAKCLYDLSLRLSDLGQEQEALENVEMAVKLLRRHYATFPSLPKPTLALSLNHLSNCLSNLGETDDALEVMEEAVKICRDLVRERPNAFNAELAMSLNNVSFRYLDTGNLEQALVMVKEASERYRALAKIYPAVFNIELAAVLNNQSNISSALGRTEDALTFVEECVQLYRRHLSRLPSRRKFEFSKALNNLSTCLSATGDGERACEVLREAIKLNESLGIQHPIETKSELAMSFTNLSSTLGDMGRKAEASEAAQRAAGLYRELAVVYPDSYQSELATALYNSAEYQSAIGQHESALEVIDEAILMYKELAEELPAVHSKDLKDAMALRSQCMDHLTIETLRVLSFASS